MALDSIEWATSTSAATTEPSAGEKANGWTSPDEATSAPWNWLWREQGVHLLFQEYNAGNFEDLIIDP